MSAESPFTSYTAAAVVYALTIGALVAVLLVGAILILTFGMMTRRSEDHVGRRTPGDLGVLKNIIWPQEPYHKESFPPEEETTRIRFRKRRKAA